MKADYMPYSTVGCIGMRFLKAIRQEQAIVQRDEAKAQPRCTRKRFQNDRFWPIRDGDRATNAPSSRDAA